MNAEDIQKELLRIADSLTRRVQDISAFPTENRKLHYVSDTLDETVTALQRLQARVPLI